MEGDVFTADSEYEFDKCYFDCKCNNSCKKKTGTDMRLLNDQDNNI